MLVRVEDLTRAREAQDSEVEPGVLVRGVRHARGSLVFIEPSPERLMYRLDERALFWRFDQRAEDRVPACCPAAIAKRLIGAAAELGFRPCAGIIAVPLFVDGEIVATPGYHPAAGVFLDLPDRLPAVVDAPTKAEAQKALATLLRPFRGYLAGRGPADTLRLRCAFTAAVLTAVLRPSLPAAPAVLVDANVPGAGKGKAARALAMIATGRLPAIITEGHAEEENEKRLAAAILSGASALLLDNLQRMLASSTLESGLTEGVATIRLFGRLIDVTVPCAALVLITANNAALRADMLRRTLPVRIVADTDQPERRHFTFDPYEEARLHRLEIVAAGLTVAKAWWAARDTEHGRRIRQTTLGSFEAWADLVAGAVEWLIGMNPIALIEERKAEDPARGAERRVIAALHQLFGEREWTAKEAAGKPAELGREATGLDPDAWAAVMSIKGDRPMAHQVGVWLRKRKDKVFGELQLLGQVDRDGIARWQVRGMRGIAGDTPSQPRKVGNSDDEYTPVNGHACGDDKSIKAGGTIPRIPRSPHRSSICDGGGRPGRGRADGLPPASRRGRQDQGPGHAGRCSTKPAGAASPTSGRACGHARRERVLPLRRVARLVQALRGRFRRWHGGTSRVLRTGRASTSSDLPRDGGWPRILVPGVVGEPAPAGDFDKSRGAMMGGLGSGGWNCSGRDTVDEHHSLSVGRLRRSGVFADGWCGRWHWLHGSQRLAEVLIVGSRQKIRLLYRVQRGQSDRQRIDETVMLHWRPCPFGGERPFLLCPGCARPVLQLHLVICRFRCRRCLQLTYASQRERDYHRTLRRARRLRQRLGAGTEAGGPIPPRPKRMHCRTYAGLVGRIDALEAAANDEAALLFIRVADHLRRQSPRSFWS